MAAALPKSRAGDRPRRRTSGSAGAARDHRRRAGAAGRTGHAVQARRADPAAAGQGPPPWLSARRAPRSCRRADDTIALGARLGADLRAGDVVVLSGPLGAGKTVLAKGIAQAMDVDGPVISPTFVLARVHPARGGGRARHGARRHVPAARPHRGATCSPNSTRWTSTPISTTPSWSSSGARDSPSGCPNATSTSGSSAHATPTCAPRSGSGAGRDVVLAIDTATPAVTAGVVRRDGGASTCSPSG